MVLARTGSVSEDCVVVGTGGPSLILTVNTVVDVPLALVAETVSEYDVFRYAPVIVKEDPEIVADVRGFVKRLYEDA